MLVCSFLYSVTCATWWLFILHAPHLVIIWMWEAEWIYFWHLIVSALSLPVCTVPTKCPHAPDSVFVNSVRVRPWIGVIGSSRTSPRLLAVSELSVFPEAAWSVVLLQQPVGLWESQLDSWSRWQGRLLSSESTPSILRQDEKDMERKSYEMNRRGWQNITAHA